MAASGELSDELAKRAVVGFAPGLRSEQGDRGGCSPFPVDEEVASCGVEEVEAGEVRPVADGGGALEHRRVQGAGQGVGGEDVEPAVAEEHGRQRHGIDQPADRTVEAPILGTRLAPHRGAGGFGQIEEVLAFVVVELESARHGSEDLFRDAGDVPLLQAGIPLRAHPGQHRDFLAPQARHASAAAGGQPDPLGGDASAPADEEVPDVIAVARALHSPTVTPGTAA